MMTSQSRGLLTRLAVGFVLVAGCWFGRPHANGLVGEFVLSDQWRILHAFYSPLANPAFMTEANYASARGVISLDPDNIAQLWEAGAVVPVGLYQSLGATWVAENGAPVQGDYYDDLGNWKDSATTSSNMNSVFMASYAVNPWARLSLGANLKFDYSSNFGEPASGGGLDLGLSYRLLQNPIFGYYVLGLSYQNAVSLNFKRGEGSAPQLKAFLHTTHIDNRLEFNFQFDMPDFLAPSSAYTPDAKKTLLWNGTGQVGFWILRFFNVMGFLGYDQTNKPQFWGVAFGINAPSINDGRDIAMTYQYRDKFTGSLTGAHSIYFRIDLGKHREELYARRMARSLDLSANELYNRALKLYYAKKYWDSYLLLTRIVSEFPDFFKNDWVTYYRGANLEKLDFRTTSVQAYREAASWSSDGLVAPYSNLGTMRVNYRNQDYPEVERGYRELMGPGTPDSLKYHAAYLMGQACIANGKYSEAIQAFSIISDLHPAYLFAQHSMAVAYILLNDNKQKAVECLENAVDYSLSTTPAQMEIVARSYLFAGYLFFEELALGKAVAALRKIPASSMYYEDALLGLSWSALKAGQWQDCVNFGGLLATASSRTVVQCEGLLLKAFGLTMQKAYPQAEELLKGTIEKVKSSEEISEDSLNVVKNRYENDRFSYESLGDTLVNTSRLSESQAKSRRTDELLARQVAQKEKIDAFPLFVDRYNRLSFFNKNRKSLSDDLEYSLVTLQGLVEKKRASKGVEGISKEQSDIDKEIQKLKQEMESKGGKGE